jgi:hypothetical protein
MSIDALQWCRRCQQDKPKREFYECHRTRCISCLSDIRKAQYAIPENRIKKLKQVRRYENAISKTKKVS